jgi:transcriptional regulator with PAS, ATPase and Fis domain
MTHEYFASKFDECSFAVTICDKEAKILYMNQKAFKTFEKYGGKDLIGKSLYNCHKPQSIEAIQKMLQEGTSNSYTILKNGIKKIIHQTPWYTNGEVAGLIELSIEIPETMPHFVR